MKWRDAAEANIAANDWVTPVPPTSPPFPPYEGVEVPVEESYREVLHPRNRRGRWVPKPKQPDVDLLLDPDGNEIDTLKAPAKPLRHPYSPEVKAIKGEEDARRVLDAHGVTLRPRTPNSHQYIKALVDNVGDWGPASNEDDGPAWGGVMIRDDTFSGALDEDKYTVRDVLTEEEWKYPTVEAAATAAFERIISKRPRITPTTWRDIVQATIDAQERWPILRTGPMRLHEYAFTSGMAPNDPRSGSLDGLPAGVWAMTTSPDPEFETAIYFNDMVDVQIEDGPRATQARFNATNHVGAQSSELAISDASVYGRTMHELGHAVADNLAAPGQRQTVYRDPFFDNGLDPLTMARVSFYGSQDPAEAWAEVFSLNMVPGYMDLVPDDGLRSTLKAVYDDVRAKAEEVE